MFYWWKDWLSKKSLCLFYLSLLSFNQETIGFQKSNKFGLNLLKLRKIFSNEAWRVIRVFISRPIYRTVLFVIFFNSWIFLGKKLINPSRNMPIRKNSLVLTMLVFMRSNDSSLKSRNFLNCWITSKWNMIG